MADYTMCQNQKCPQADNCWRFGCPPSKPFQSYQIFEPEKDDEENFECSFFKPYPDERTFHPSNVHPKSQSKGVK